MEEVKTRQTESKKRIDELELQVQVLNAKLSESMKAIIHCFHVAGMPHDILKKHGLNPFDPEEEKKKKQDKAA